MVGEIKSCVLKMRKAGLVRILKFGSDEQCIEYFMNKAQAQFTNEGVKNALERDEHK